MRVLRERDFRHLFTGQAPSTVGDRIVFLAPALYVTEIGSRTDVGIVLAAATIPLLAFLLIGGVWADRLPRHRVMIVTDIVRFALHGRSCCWSRCSPPPASASLCSASG